MLSRHPHSQTIFTLLQGHGFLVTLNRMADGAVFVIGARGDELLGFAIGGPDPLAAAATEGSAESFLAVSCDHLLDMMPILAHVQRFEPAVAVSMTDVAQAVRLSA